MRIVAAVLVLGASLWALPRCQAAQELSAGEMQAVTGSLPCVLADHYCICNNPTAGCCDITYGCMMNGAGLFEIKANHSNWGCMAGGTYQANCHELFTCACCVVYVYRVWPCTDVPQKTPVGTLHACACVPI